MRTTAPRGFSLATVSTPVAVKGRVLRCLVTAAAALVILGPMAAAESSHSRGTERVADLSSIAYDE